MDGNPDNPRSPHNRSVPGIIPQVHTDAGSTTLTGGTTGMEQIFQAIGGEPIVLWGLTVTNDVATSDPRPCFFYISPSREGSGRTFSVKYASAYNDASWEFAYPGVYIAQGFYLRVFAYSATGSTIRIQYSASENLKNWGATTS